MKGVRRASAAHAPCAPGASAAAGALAAGNGNGGNAVGKGETSAPSGEPVTGTGELLRDVGQGGRERPWQQHRREAVRTSAAYARLGGEHARRAARVRDCGSLLTFAECGAAPEHPKRLEAANFCRERLCGMCQWRRSLKLGHQVRRVTAEVERQAPGTGWLLLTLTERNSAAEALPGAVGEMLGAWERLRRRQAYGERVQGSFRALEVTCNRERGDYHPHLHALLAVGPEYWHATYVKQATWRTWWQAALRVDYDPRVDVRRVRDLGDVSCEVAKYATKPGDFVSLSRPGTEENGDEQEAESLRVGALHAALRGRQLVAYTGTLRRAYRDLELAGEVEDIDGGDLVHVGEAPAAAGKACATCGQPMQAHEYGWRVGVTWDDGRYVG